MLIIFTDNNKNVLNLNNLNKKLNILKYLLSITNNIILQIKKNYFFNKITKGL